MEPQGVVVVIRLSDVSECDQPDPLCLRAEDLSKWRHLEVMLRNMYKDPPQAIKVAYIDNEDDWIQISCDEELAEAVRVAQQSDNILLFQVKRQDPLIYFESTLSSIPSAVPDTPASTSAEEENLRSIAAQPLVYPDSGPSSCRAGPHSGQSPTTPLVYPHPDTNVENHSTGSNENVMLLQANGKAASIENRPDLSTDEKIARLKSMMSPESVENRGAAQGLNALSSGATWDQASSLPSREKLKFLKGLVSSQGESGPNPDASSGEVEQEHRDPLSGEALLLVPLGPETDHQGKDPLPNQDPFETRPSGSPYAADLEEAHLPTPTLTPMKTTPQNVSVQIEASQASDSSQSLEAPTQGTPLGARSPHPLSQPLAPTEKMRIGKTLPMTPPVPLPRTLQMMEGAQSGANAVAIEIPESYHGAAHKEEDVTASGGTSCTSASAETGEVASDRSPHAAAVGREMKSTTDPSAVSTIGNDARAPATQVTSLSKKTNPDSKKKSESRKSESRVKKKEHSGKEHGSKKKSSSEKNKKDAAAKKETKTVKADVESGEKTVSAFVVDGTAPHKDLIKYMRRMKKELHSNIVKDVAKQTDRLMKKNFERSLSTDSTFLREGLDGQRDVHHQGIYCDCCNNVIYGIRYKCGNCLDFDLCASCEVLPGVHYPSHVFLKLRRPVTNFVAEAPLLGFNMYECDSPRMESISEEEWDRFSRMSRQSSFDLPNSPVRRSSEGEAAKWFWDSTGTSHELQVELPALLNVTVSDAVRFSLLDSQEKAEDLSMRKPCNSTTSVEEVQVVPALSAERETPDCVQSVPALEVSSVTRQEEEGSQARDDGATVPETQESQEYTEIKSEQEDEGEENEEEAKEEEVREQVDDEASESLDENFDIMDGGNQTQDDSDTSDDFCVIDPPSREEFETCGMEFSAHSERLVAMLNTYPAEPEGVPGDHDPVPVETDSMGADSPFLSTIVKQESLVGPSSMENVSQENAETTDSPTVTKEEIVGQDEQSSVVDAVEAPSPQTDGAETDEAEVNDGSTDASQNGDGQDITMPDGTEEDVFMKMSAEERRNYFHMVETLKRRAVELECQLKERETVAGAWRQEEKEVQQILEAKQKEAVRENERLEMLKMTEVVQKLERWQSGHQGPRRADEKIVLQREKERQFQEHKRRKDTPQGTTQAQSDRPTSLSPTATSVDYPNVVYQTRKEAYAHTPGTVDPANQASQMLQHFTNGVSKAATSAFSTAKDVIYSLQAKQMEKKAATGSPRPSLGTSSSTDDSWTPPAHVWTPPKEEFVPPKSEWTPPKQEWTPPKQEWNPPKQEWTPPKQEWTPPKHEWTPPKSEWTPPSSEVKPACDQNSQLKEDGPRPRKKEAGRHSQDSPSSPTPPIHAIPVANSALRQEVLAMQRLMEMGFANREQNRQLLHRFGGDLEKVVQSLLQEEGGNHWAMHRH